MFKNKKKSKKITIIPKLLLFSFIIIASVQVISTLIIFNSPEFTEAATIKLTPNVPIGDDKPIVFNTYTTSPIADYISTVYEYAIGVVGIVAAVMMMIGGLIWLTAGGNATQVSKAKSYITASLGGLVLALGSYMILAQINPALVNPNISDITPIGKGEEQKTISIVPSNADCKAEEKYTNDNKIINPDDGTIRSPDAYCPGMSTVSRTIEGQESTLVGAMSPQLRDYCYCTYNPLPGYTWSAGSTCSGDEKPYADTPEKGAPLCGSTIGTGKICCGPKIPEECKGIERCRKIFGEATTITKEAGLTCVATGCQANALLVEKLGSLRKNFSNSEFFVTEAWPPSDTYHSQDCHYDGTCLDLDPSNMTTEDRIRLIDMADTLDLEVDYECIGSNCCAGFEAGTCEEFRPGRITGDHFSVYLKGVKK